MGLQYVFCVNLIKDFLTKKNANIEEKANAQCLFKTDLLQMTPEELNLSLELFVTEIRKSDGTEYPADTIYYLMLGLQQYLNENESHVNIFTDPAYINFTYCLDAVAMKFSSLSCNSKYILTRVDEDHLWEAKQLGAHSPQVLLNTMIYFNMKYFNLLTYEEHMQLTFSQITKHSEDRCKFLCYAPPQGATGDEKKKNAYDIYENEEDPLRCPVRLHQFYLSKCPEHVKKDNLGFYFEPEETCTPESTFWYKATPVTNKLLNKIIHLFKMVNEINISTLTD